MTPFVFPRKRLTLALAVALAAPPAIAQTLDLRMSRELAPPTPPLDPATGRRAPPAFDSPDRGTLILRADRIEGTRERVEATGDVELRARRETVIADYLSYDFATQTIHGRGDVTLRQGNDFVTGPELTYKRDTETGTFESPRFAIGENNARGDADRLTFVGPNLFEALRARVTTCTAPREDWFLRAERIDIDSAKKVGVARDARLDFMGVPILYSPYLEFPLSNDRKSGFLTPTFGSSHAPSDRQCRNFDVRRRGDLGDTRASPDAALNRHLYG